MTHPRIAVIGAGNMGGCLLRGLIECSHPKENLWASNPNTSQLDALQSELNFHTTLDNLEAQANADIIVLAVKPHKMHTVATQLAPVFVNNPHPRLVLSIAAGIRTATLSKWLGGYQHIICAMPNLPSAMGVGATGLYAMPAVSTEMRNNACALMQSLGEVVWVQDEKLLDVVTALSGCGPAYYFLIMQALADAATEMGLPADIAHALSPQTALGAATMAKASVETLAALRQRVTSPKGATEQGLKILNAENLTDILKNALIAAKTRAATIATESEEW